MNVTPSLARLAVLAALAVSLGACSIFDGKDEEAEPAELVDFDATLRVRKVWDASLGGNSEGLRLGLVPATNGARVFAASADGDVAAFDALTGERVWRARTELPLSGGPGVGRDRIAVGSSEGDLATLAIDNGELLWRVAVGSEVLAAPALSTDKVVVRTGDGRLVAFDAQNGEQLWEIQKVVQGLTLRGNAPPVISGPLVVAGFDDGTLAAVSLADGSVVWERSTSERRGRTELARLADVDGRMAIVGEDLFAAGFQGTAALMSIETGTPAWRLDFSTHEALALDWNRLYMTREDDTVVALNRTTGVIAWEQPALTRRNVTGPAVAGSVVAVGDLEGYVHFLDAGSGEFVARVKAGSGAIVAAPMVVSDIVYVLDSGGTLVALRPAAAQP